MFGESSAMDPRCYQIRMKHIDLTADFPYQISFPFKLILILKNSLFMRRSKGDFALCVNGKSTWSEKIDKD